jgi:hypothetical protein
MSECPSTHLYKDPKSREMIRLQCRLQAGHIAYHEAHYDNNIILWW